MPKLSLGNPLLLHYLRVPKILGEEVGGYQDFTSKIYCLTVPKSFVWESFTVELFSSAEKFWRRGGGGGYQDFTSKIYCLTVPKSFVWESVTVELFWGTEKVWRRGGYQDFTSKNFCLTVPKYFVGES